MGCVCARVHAGGCARVYVRACVHACVRNMLAIYDNNILPKLIMIIIKKYYSIFHTNQTHFVIIQFPATNAHSTRVLHVFYVTYFRMYARW